MQVAGLAVSEVNRPNRFDRGIRGKRDPFDVYSVAEAVLSGRASAAPKGTMGWWSRSGCCALEVVCTLRQDSDDQPDQGMLITAPEELRSRYRGLSNTKLITARAASRPTPTPVTVAEATAYSLRPLARRWQALTEQIEDLARHLQRLLEDHAPDLMSVFGYGRDTVAQLLITAGDNPDRLLSEAAFVALDGGRPIQASSGKTNRHRLNRAGDRRANSALPHRAHAAALRSADP